MAKFLPAPSEISQRIVTLRGDRVILGPDLAILYGVATKVLNQAVSRNRDRFPPDFMFQVAPEEWANLRSQIVTSSWGGHRWRPYAFTEQCVAMLSSVLRSPRAVAVNVEIMRAFVRLRRLMIEHADLASRLTGWSENTIRSSKWVLTRFGNSWRNRTSHRPGGLDSIN